MAKKVFSVGPSDLRRLDEVHPLGGHPVHPHHRPQRDHDLKVRKGYFCDKKVG